MFQQILYLTGIDKKLAALKYEFETKANDSWPRSASSRA
jgi:hypothetical protein